MQDDNTPQEGVKSCPRCSQVKPTAHFGKCATRHDGLTPWCKPCRRGYEQTARKTYNQDAQTKRTRDYYLWLKSTHEGVPCLDCKNVYPFHIMEFDHVRGDKRYTIGKMANHARGRVLEELSKCELVCCACHRARSYTRRTRSENPRVVSFREWVAPFKATPCRDCGKTLSSEAMDFDHVRGVKVAQVSDMWSWSRPKAEAEIAKCEVVCANCHRERTWQRSRGAPRDSRPVPCAACGVGVWGYAGTAQNVKCGACRKTPLKHLRGDTAGTVSCRVCGLARTRLGKHLQAAHGLSPETYRAQFPDAPVEVVGTRTRSAECRAKQSAAARERWSTPEAREEQSERLKASAPWKGKHLSDEHRQAISEGGRGKKHNITPAPSDRRSFLRAEGVG